MQDVTSCSNLQIKQENKSRNWRCHSQFSPLLRLPRSSESRENKTGWKEKVNKSLINKAQSNLHHIMNIRCKFTICTLKAYMYMYCIHGYTPPPPSQLFSPYCTRRWFLPNSHFVQTQLCDKKEKRKISFIESFIHPLMTRVKINGVGGGIFSPVYSIL